MTGDLESDVARNGKPTLADIATLTGYGTNTVSLALRGSTRISQSARDGIQRAAEALDYVPNNYAKSLVLKKSHTVGMLMEDLTNHPIQMLSVVSTNGPLTEQISTLELYLQDVHNLHESLMVALDAKQNVACDREIGFEWALYLDSRPPFRSSSLVFEMIMLYHMKVSAMSSATAFCF